MSTGSPTPVFQLRDDEEFDITFEADDKAGNRVPLDPSIALTVAVSDPTLLLLTKKDDSTYTVASTGLLGSGQLSVKATTDGNEINGSLAIEVVPSAADHFTITPSPTRPKV